MEIIRKNELQEILDLVKMMSHGIFLITGAAGSGKTFLLNILLKYKNTFLIKFRKYLHNRNHETVAGT